MKKIITIIIALLLLVLIAILIFKIWVKNNKEKEQIPVLMYHQVVYDEYYDGRPDTISLSTLEKQFKYLRDNKYKTLTMDELYCWKIGKCKFSSKSVVLTFDDGLYSFPYLVEPLLKKYNLHATCFVIGSTVDKSTKKYKPTKYGTVGEDLISKHSDNVNYQSHSYDMHKYVDEKQKIYSMNKKEMQEDIDKMSDLGEFSYIAYPYNTDTDEFIEILKKNNYKLAFRGESEKVIRDTSNYQIPRIGVKEDFNHFKSIFETQKYNNRYGSGILEKFFVTIERKFKIRLG